ncbi:M15 family metallopeptidase [Emergencia timonensis]|nr:M15 family metallopeptidase [Emergencia timonensis]WNX87094.1 M15 family metallopeptidase [Emergencia timonensis]
MKKIAEFRQEGYSRKDAEELAKQWVAIPGTSEHELGLAVDINGDTYDIYPWLQENSYKYGFIFRCPADKKDITGIAEEVWHYRYVGLKAAKEIYESGLCLEEYLDRD